MEKNKIDPENNKNKTNEKKRTVSKEGLKRIIFYYKNVPNAKISILFVILCAIGIGILSVIVPQQVRKLLSDYLAKNDIWAVFFFSVKILGLTFLSIILISISTKISSTITAEVTSKIRSDAYNKYLESDHYYYDKTSSGSILSKISRDVEKTGSIGLATVKQIFSSLITLFYGGYYMFSVSWVLSLTTIGLIVIFPIFFGIVGGKLAKKERNFLIENANGTQHLNISIMGIKLIKSFATENIEENKFDENNKKYFKNLSEKTFLQNMMQQMGSPIFTLIQVGILFVGALLIINKSLTLGDIVAFYLFISMAIQPIVSLFFLQVSMIEGTTAMESVSELLDSKTQIDLNEKSELSEYEGDLMFDNVSFSYEGSAHPQLKNFTYNFRNGRKYAIVGPSGSGKTTLISLISKFYNVSSGKITINDIDLNEYNIRKLRKNIGIVQQDVFIFPGTLNENISYGLEGKSQKEIQDAAKKANLHEEILKMDNGYETIIGENGTKLSGGQKQRVSIARMFLKDPQLLILDEATSALDTITEQKIQNAFEKLMENRTSITIAHRLTTITNSDEILVLENGKLILDGTHNELLSEEGLYKELFNAMMKDKK